MSFWNALLLKHEKDVSFGRFLWLSLGNIWLKLFLMMAQIAATTTLIAVLCHKAGYCGYDIKSSLSLLALASLWFVLTICFNVPVIGTFIYAYATIEIIAWGTPSSAWFVYPLGLITAILADIRQIFLMNALSRRYRNPVMFQVLPVIAFFITLPVFAHWYIWALLGADNFLNPHSLLFTAIVFTIFMLYLHTFPKKKASHA